MKLTLDLNEKLSKSLKDIANKDLLSVEDVAKGMIAACCKQCTTKSQKPNWLLQVPNILRLVAGRVDDIIAHQTTKKE